jgi:PhnB protein
MAPKVNPLPQGYHTVTPNLAVHDAAEALAFYRKAFGAEETVRMPGPDGKIMHAEFRIGDSVIMLGDERPDMGARGPKAYGGTPVRFYVYVENVDAAWKRAIDAGAKSVMPVQDMFWGDRTGCLEDPFGHVWNLAQHVGDPTPEEIQRGQEEFLARFQTAS